MSSRSLSKQAADTTEPESKLPLWDGTHLTGLPWLRELEACEHLFDADVAYYLRTAAVVTSAAKTAVSSLEHSALLSQDIIRKQNYSVTNPPPDDNFKELYANIQAKIAADEPPFTGPAIKTALPSKAALVTLPDTHILSPDRIMLIDLKLRNAILALITSRGRKLHYQQLTQSGVTLLKQLLEDTKPSAGAYTQSPYILQLKAQLAQLQKVTLSCPSQIEFDQIRDSIDEVNCQLDEEDRMTSHQLCDHYISLISKLKSQPLWLALQVELRTAAVKYGDTASTLTCITRVLTTFIAHEQALADEASGQGGTGRALPGMDTDHPPGGRDPIKTGLGKKGPPKTPCPICKKMHWKNKCFQNVNADEDAKKLAVRIAPKSPAALAYLKVHPELAPDTNNTNPAMSKDKKENEDGAGLTTVQTSSSEDIIAAAFDDPNPQSIIIGHGKLAADTDYYSDEDNLESKTYTSMSKSFAISSSTAVPLQGTCVSSPTERGSKHSQLNINNLSYEAELPHQLHLSVAARTTEDMDLLPALDLKHKPARSVQPVQAGGVAPWIVALLCVAAATAASVITMTVPSFFYQGMLESYLMGTSCVVQNLNSAGSLCRHCLLSVASQQMYDLSGALVAHLFLTVITALAVRSTAISCLRASVILSQALHRARTRKSKINNYFTCLFKANYTLVSCGVVRAALDPCTYCFALAHVLLLACILCPASRLLNIDNGHSTYHCVWWRSNHLKWINLPRPMLSRVRLALVSLFLAELYFPPYLAEPGPLAHITCLSSVASLCLMDPTLSIFTTKGVCHGPTTRQCHQLALGNYPASTDYPLLPPSSEKAFCKAFLGANQSNQVNTHKLTLRRKLIIDSGASFHVHPHAEDLINLRPCNNRIMGIDHKPHVCSSMGDFPVLTRGDDGSEYNVLIKNVRCAPSFKDSLISINQLWLESKVDVLFKDVCCLITPCGKRLPFEQPKGTGLYVWRVLRDAPSKRKHVRFSAAEATSSQSESASPCSSGTSSSAVQSAAGAPSALSFRPTHSSKSVSHIASLAPDTAAQYMHRRLHVGARRMNLLPSLTADAPDNLSRAKVGSCPHCVTANANHHPHKSDRYEESMPGRLIHADIAGPFVKSAVGHHEYLLVLVDDHSRFKFGIPLVKRSDAPARIRSFIANFNNFASRTGATVQPISTLHTDGAGEFTSGKFRDELAEVNVHKTESPTEIHALNGVAERAIKSIFAHVRADLEASGAPKSFWPFAVAHAIDILNRTTCPPHNRHTSYESLTGDQPRIMSLWPWGCKAYSVKPSSHRSKTNLDSTAWEGIHIGRSTSQPGSYLVWIPSLSKVVSSSDVYMDETYMPWRKAGDRQIGDPIPLPADGDAGQPPTLPETDVTETARPTQVEGSIAAEFDRVARLRSPTISNPNAKSARLSRRILVLFSGPYSRPDGLIAFLLRLGLQVTAIDNDGSKGGNPAHDILNNSVYESILRRAQRGEFLAVFAAPPCSTFSICRFIKSPTAADGGPPVVRRRSGGQVTGVNDCPPAHRREVKRANELIARTCSILHAAVESGSEFALENPADRGDVKNLETFVDADHAPLWLMPDIISLSTFASCRYATFPMCAFGVNYEKPTTLMYTPGLSKHLQDLDLLRCTHKHKHDGKAGGEKVNGVWNSAAAASYPAELNLWIAQALAALAVSHREIPLHPLVAQRAEGRDDVAYESDSSPLAKSKQPVHEPVEPMPSTPHSIHPDVTSPIKSEVKPNLTSDAIPAPASELHPPPTPNKVSSSPGKKKPWWFTDRPDPIATRTRSNSRRDSSGTAMFTAALQSAYEGFPESGDAFVMQADATARKDPRNHEEAMADDSDGWLKAESEELQNHQSNGSFTLMDRTEFERVAPNRRLVKLVWVYKRKRSGRMKARLCVQGCTQQPGVDFDQTHCAAMRGTSLR